MYTVLCSLYDDSYANAQKMADFYTVELFGLIKVKLLNL